MGSASCCAQCFRFLFAIVNALFLVIGLALIGVGIYSIISANTYEFISGNNYASGGIVLIVSGIVTTFIAGLGFVGACFKWRPLLVVYIIVLSIVVILTITAGVLALVYKDKVYSTSESQYADGWERAIEEYNTNNNARRTVDTLQRTLQCCGGNNYTDWFDTNVTTVIPYSCNCSSSNDSCKEVSISLNGTTISRRVYTSGCIDSTLDLARQIAYVVGGVGVAFGIFEIIGIFIAVGLVIWITKTKTDGYQVV